MGQLRRTPDTLSAYEHLQVALSTVTAVNGTVQHADTKAGILAAIQAGMATVMATEEGPLPAAAGARIPVHVAALVAGIVFTGAFLMSGRYLVQALWPRLQPAPVPSRFGIATLIDMNPAAMVSTRPSEQCQEAWELARLLAGIAMRKHGCVARAVP